MRDHSALPALSRYTPSTMPLDKPKNGTPAKPFTPTLSTAFQDSKSPLTPKLVGVEGSSPVSPPHRGLRSEWKAPPMARRDDFRSPTTPKLSDNVTPRSGARLSRIGGGSPSTPGSSKTGTPSRTRPLSAIELSKPRKYLGTTAGLAIETPGSKQNASPAAHNTITEGVVSGGVGRRVSTGSPRNGTANSISPGLLHADKEHPSSASEIEETAGTKKATNFFHASDAARRTNSPEPLPMTYPFLEEEEQGKFCYANDRPRNQVSTSPNLTMAAKANAATSFYPQSQAPNTQRATRVLQQPPSPTKAESLRSAPATFSSASGKSIKPKPTGDSANPWTSVSPCDTPRRASTSSKTSTVRETATRKLSIANPAPTTPPKRAQMSIGHRATKSQDVLRQAAMPPSPIQHFSPRSTSLSSTNTGVSTRTLDSTPSNSAHPLSPLKSTTPQSPLQTTNELAANARRERKVLDLEISNSSLLAINRTLEREMHKQSLELRRFRRLSHSRQVSMVSNSVRSISGHSRLSTVTGSEDDRDACGNLSDLEEMSNSEGDGSDLDSSFDDDSSLQSPTSHTGHDIRQRARDEKRLMLDLGKHQQLLIDSQKMNQSIKRCLNWTEELINEGKKALEYQVKVSDVEVGGKVLALDHDDEGDEGGGARRNGLLSPSLPVSTPAEVKQERRLWRQGLEEMEMELDRMLASSTTLKEVVPP